VRGTTCPMSGAADGTEARRKATKLTGTGRGGQRATTARVNASPAAPHHRRMTMSASVVRTFSRVPPRPSVPARTAACFWASVTAIDSSGQRGCGLPRSRDRRQPPPRERHLDIAVLAGDLDLTQRASGHQHLRSPAVDFQGVAGPANFETRVSHPDGYGSRHLVELEFRALRLERHGAVEPAPQELALDDLALDRPGDLLQAGVDATESSRSRRPLRRSRPRRRSARRSPRRQSRPAAQSTRRRSRFDRPHALDGQVVAPVSNLDRRVVGDEDAQLDARVRVRLRKGETQPEQLAVGSSFMVSCRPGP